jgi:hypothetical protein
MDNSRFTNQQQSQNQINDSKFFIDHNLIDKFIPKIIFTGYFEELYLNFYFGNFQKLLTELLKNIFEIEFVHKVIFDFILFSFLSCCLFYLFKNKIVL